MNTKILYSFTIYFRHPRLFGACNLFNNTSSVVDQWDKSITIMASSVKDVMENLPDGFDSMEVVKVEYPSGWPNFPLFPPSTCSSGAVEINSITGEHYLRAV